MWDLVVLRLYFQRRLTLGSAGNQVSETKQVELLQPAGRGLTGMKRSLTFLSVECPDNKGGKYGSCAPSPGGARFLAWPDLDVSRSRCEEGKHSWAISHLPFWFLFLPGLSQPALLWGLWEFHLGVSGHIVGFSDID